MICSALLGAKSAANLTLCRTSAFSLGSHGSVVCGVILHFKIMSAISSVLGAFTRALAKMLASTRRE